MLPVGVGAEEVGAQRRTHDAQEATEDQVTVEALDGVDGLLDAALQLGRALGIGARRVEAGAKQLEQQGGHVGMRGQHVLHVAIAVGGARLAQVAGHGPQHGHVAPGQAGREDEAVVAVVLDLALPGAGERLLERLADRRGVGIAVAAMHQAEVVDPGGLAVPRLDRVGPLVGHLDAHVLEQRQHVRQRQRASASVELGAQHSRRGLERPVEADLEPGAVGQLLQMAQIGERRARHPVGPVGGGEGFAVAAEQTGASLLALVLEQGLLEVVDP